LEVVEMSVGRLVVTGVRLEGRKVAEVARDYGVSRQWVYTLLRRYDAEGEAGLEPRSRRPHGNARATPPEVEQRIVELRKQLVDEGLDAGAHTIAWHLEREFDQVPAPSTIWRILHRRGFVTPEPRKRPKSSSVRFQADQPNERWQADATHWQLADDTAVEILNILDDHSRLLIWCSPGLVEADSWNVHAAPVRRAVWDAGATHRSSAVVQSIWSSRAARSLTSPAILG
jgi:transposase